MNQLTLVKPKDGGNDQQTPSFYAPAQRELIFGAPGNLSLSRFFSTKVPDPRDKLDYKFSKSQRSLAFDNKPFANLTCYDFTVSPLNDEQFVQSLGILSNTLFVQRFPQLSDLGINLLMSKEQISEIIKAECDRKPYLKETLTADELSMNSLKSILEFAVWVHGKNKFDGKFATGLHSIVSAFRVISDSIFRSKFIEPIGKQCQFNKERYIFEIPLVLPIENLKEILLAYPVWFLNGAGVDTAENIISPAKKMICDYIGSSNFSWLYQFYNINDRSIDSYRGIDAIPTDYLRFRETISPELEIIATPYLNFCPKIFTSKVGIIPTDPIAFTLNSYVPFITIHKHWSANGILPNILDLISSTIEHLKLNLDSIKNFDYNSWAFNHDEKSGKMTGIASITLWHTGNAIIQNKSVLWNGQKNQNTLYDFTKSLLNAFSQKKVFQFL